MRKSMLFLVGSCAYRKPRPGPLRLPQGRSNMLHSLFCILLISNVLLSFGEAQPTER